MSVAVAAPQRPGGLDGKTGSRGQPERPGGEAEHALLERALLERLGVAVQSAGFICCEYSCLQDRFTWFDNLPPGMPLRGSAIESQQLALIGSIVPEDAQAVREQTGAALIAGQTTLTSMVRRRDAHRAIQHVRLFQKFRDADGKPIRALGTTSHVTAEVAAADQLRQQAQLLAEQQQRLERASLSMHQGRWELDIASHRHWASMSYLALGVTQDSAECDSLEKVTNRIHPWPVPAPMSMPGPLRHQCSSFEQAALSASAAALQVALNAIGAELSRVNAILLQATDQALTAVPRSDAFG